MKIRIILITTLTIISCLNLHCQNVLKISEIDNNFYNIPLEYFVRAYVSRVVDGDTLEVIIENHEYHELNRKEKVRLIGVDTPETKHPNKGIQYFGEEAYAYTKKRLEGKYIYLLFDRDIRDKYERLLCYVIENDYNMFNYELVYYGFSKAYTVFEFTFIHSFKKAEEEAKSNNYGLWEH